MRVVIDKNVLISAFLSRQGTSARILVLFETGIFEVVVSQPILDEYQAALGYERVRQRHGMTDEEIKQRIADLRTAALFVTPTVSVAVVSDPDDNMLFAAAIAGQADVVVSGDTAVQAVKEYQGIRVLPPALFLALLEQKI